MAGRTAAMMLPLNSVADAIAAAPGVGTHLARGGVIASPTETIYGFSSALSPGGLAALGRLKERPPEQPFLVLVGSMAMLAEMQVTVPEYAHRLMQEFWPGPLTMILPMQVGAVHESLRGPDGGVAIRWTSHRPLAALIEAIGRPISSTSANRSNMPPTASAEAIADEFAADVADGSLMVLDGGLIVAGLPSTIVNCVGEQPVLVREGAIPAVTIATTAGIQL